MPQKDYKKIMEEKNRQKMEEQNNRTHMGIIKTIKDRKRVEMEYLGAVKRQMGYWKSQIDATDSEKDRERYDELKENIKSEEAHIKQIQNELDRINEEIRMENKYQRNKF
ncbi:hypothetical protein [Methanobacterium sp. ACI-7]|uniref:hypothetical protein n=1 Tax=unclassified Methanobacterium TaxID=2627676 RepID=UPI0039C1B9C4